MVIPGLATVMRVFTCLWFALSILWMSDSVYMHAVFTTLAGIACFAYAEWLDHYHHDRRNA